MKVKKLCYVYFNPIRENEEVSFYKLPIKRMFEICGNDIILYVLFSGDVQSEKFQIGSVRQVRYTKKIYKHKLFNLIFNIFPLISHARVLKKNENIDIFMNVWNHYCLFPLVWALKPLQAKIIARIAGDPIQSRGKLRGFRSLKQKIFLVFERLSLISADQIAYIDEYMVKKIPPAGKKYTILPPGINLDLFKPCSDTHKNKAIKDSKKIVLFIGRIHKRKGIIELIEAFNLLASKQPELYLYLIGPSQFEFQEIKSNYWGRIKWLSVLKNDDLVSFYQKASCLVLPSKSEALGNVVIEALSCGCPVVTTSNGPMRNIIQDAGIIIDSLEPKKIAQAIQTIISKKGPNKKQLMAARSRIEAKYSYTNIRNRYLQLWE